MEMFRASLRRRLLEGVADRGYPAYSQAQVTQRVCLSNGFAPSSRIALTTETDRDAGGLKSALPGGR